MNKGVYERLRVFLDRLPSGFPSTPDGIEIRLLKKLFSPSEAELTCRLSDDPETVAVISSRIGMEPSILADRLESMAKKGLIFRVRRNGEPLYQAYQFMIGIYEFQVMALDREFCELFEAYLPYVALSISTVKTSQMRILPVESAVETAAEVGTYDRIRELVSKQELVCVAPCICKKEHEILGTPCDKPVEVCLGFADFARFYLDNGFAREIDHEEAFQILDQAEAAGLVLMPTNSKEISAVCCCCTCCCASLKYVKMASNPARWVHAPYYAAVDADLCTFCEDCMERCPMDALEAADDVMTVIKKRCIGCGLCVSACPTEALKMIPKPDMPIPPDRYSDTIKQISAERGLDDPAKKGIR